ncbi:hypothetical protein EHQ81_18795 [Leptospira selangorensis]|uniref:Uncharacterized protein n=1 Tax=Leptospira selangorensis TaxID=2484982 RepID=A0A4R9FWV4_9LEPT|nr:hypothetical protein [Leptospira selangorensis]TGK03442.1 hypothetical protein EHO58_13545 [Leptospira selangorensis]TGM10863.1 hypothetical protein EHQ81_18795 [Leptospira selangorensis]TGM26898.1 hypothetical protein EHQ82_02515 [Leptospira selangorensis]
MKKKFVIVLLFFAVFTHCEFENENRNSETNSLEAFYSTIIRKPAQVQFRNSSSVVQNYTLWQMDVCPGSNMFKVLESGNVNPGETSSKFQISQVSNSDIQYFRLEVNSTCLPTNNSPGIYSLSIYSPASVTICDFTSDDGATYSCELN